MRQMRSLQEKLDYHNSEIEFKRERYPSAIVPLFSCTSNEGKVG